MYKQITKTAAYKRETPTEKSVKKLPEQSMTKSNQLLRPKRERVPTRQNLRNRKENSVAKKE